ncbi:OLC1v1010009C1 [Oldenlandia corymbosa var. corymbosa]|uniref:OLC1v1010009C1 n=1 Tax=Oldenlandia corymbosa var. corymbosa TaxID=529605 RepID=A0AAV1DSN8_OLDCO|nr:OLC1v1010009C1 [Oldenlandia corymbosa var. corymbosa]
METLNHVVRLLEAFRVFDADSDGLISSAELGGIMGSLGYNPSEADIQQMMQQGDTNHDGLLSIDEFLNLHAKNSGLGGVANSLERVLHGFDVDGEEFVTGEELFEAIRTIGQQELTLQDCQCIVASMDGDGDGAIDVEDLRVIVNALL